MSEVNKLLTKAKLPKVQLLRLNNLVTRKLVSRREVLSQTNLPVHSGEVHLNIEPCNESRDLLFKYFDLVEKCPAGNPSAVEALISTEPRPADNPWGGQCVLLWTSSTRQSSLERLRLMVRAPTWRTMLSSLGSCSECPTYNRSEL